MAAPSRVEVVERMTSQEFLRFAPESQKAELIDGVMIVHSPPLDSHEHLQIFLLTLLRMYSEEHDRGEVRGSRTPVVLDDDQTYMSDVLFVARRREDIIRSKGIFGAPDLVVEILSAGTERHDRGAKFRAYERAGVRELWLIDPYGPAGTEFYQRRDDRFAPIVPNEEGILHSVAVPNFWIDVAWLWPDERFVPVGEALERIAGV